MRHTLEAYDRNSEFPIGVYLSTGLFGLVTTVVWALGNGLSVFVPMTLISLFIINMLLDLTHADTGLTEPQRYLMKAYRRLDKDTQSQISLDRNAVKQFNGAEAVRADEQLVALANTIRKVKEMELQSKGVSAEFRQRVADLQEHYNNEEKILQEVNDSLKSDGLIS